MLRFLAALLFAVAAHAAPPAAIAWSPADHSEFVAVTADSATRSSLGGGAYQSCRSDTAQSGGTRTVHFTVDQVGSSEGTGRAMLVGLGSGKAPLNKYAGSDSYGVGYNADGRILKNALVAAVTAAYTTGDAIDMEANLDLHTVRFRKVGGSWSPTIDITSLGSPVYVMCSMGNGATAPVVRVSDTDWNDFPWTTMNVIAHGDSMTLTSGVQQIYHSRLLSLIEANRSGWAQGVHLGINGVSWQFAWSAAGYPYNLAQDAPIRVDPARGPLPNWLIAFAGTNGFALAHHTAATEYAHLQAYIQARVAAGWEADKIIVCTMLPRAGVAQVTVDAYNALIVADALGLGYRVARLDLQTIEIQADGVHPTDNGHQVIAQTIYDAMFSAQQQQYRNRTASNAEAHANRKVEVASLVLWREKHHVQDGRRYRDEQQGVEPKDDGYNNAHAINPNRISTIGRTTRRNCFSSDLIGAFYSRLAA